MGFFEGLTPEQEAFIRENRAVHSYASGADLFREGDTATGLYIILSGSVEIYRVDDEGVERRLNILESGDVLGEMGLIADIRRRSACARTLETSELLFVDGNPITALNRIGGPAASLPLFRTLVGILGKRLTRKDKRIPNSLLGRTFSFSGQNGIPPEAFRIVGDILSANSLHGALVRIPLKRGEYLFNDFDPVDGFYILREGELEVIFEGGREIRSLGRIKPPALIGEVAYFTNEPRSAGVRATMASEVDHFPGIAFERMEKEDPPLAAHVLFVVVELLVSRIVEQDSR